MTPPHVRATPATVRRAPRATPAAAMAGEDSVSARLDDETRSAVWGFVSMLDNPTTRVAASTHDALEADSVVP